MLNDWIGCWGHYGAQGSLHIHRPCLHIGLRTLAFAAVNQWWRCDRGQHCYEGRVVNGLWRVIDEVADSPRTLLCDWLWCTDAALGRLLSAREQHEIMAHRTTGIGTVCAGKMVITPGEGRRSHHRTGPVLKRRISSCR